jgi:hypothetical protein
MDWFEKLTGFRETGYSAARAKLKVEGNRLSSLANGKSYCIGELELVSLQALRVRVKSSHGLPGRLRMRGVTGDVRKMHELPEYAGALFQVASQFNLLEMTGPEITPEDGVTLYQDDRTQGPACAIAAGAATIYRNYFAPVSGHQGQTRNHQLNGLADLGAALSKAVDQPVEALWKMRNGYALCSSLGLDAISEHLGNLQPDEVDALRGKLSIGVHSGVAVTDSQDEPQPLVSQAFCSALPVAYTPVPPARWKAFASLVLEAAYEATMLAAVVNKQRGASNVVLLTSLGGGAFRNEEEWIVSAMRRALRMFSSFDLDVRLVSYATPSRAIRQISADFG